ncbi:hypothetical protein BUALT_Bualt01G0141700 [Buddleja alternifolia]|uniref:ATP-dependent DNA helicase n=1 Tax=Buddleja alternifolia TaxID=168488 RepID=A0AAV6YFJ8_9LAMI|nr:hypothetical protein BUALT_Bualt01G0141700 [Buddleja alternifolia]
MFPRIVPYGCKGCDIVLAQDVLAYVRNLELADFIPRRRDPKCCRAMDTNDDKIVAELVDMGFDISDVTNAIKAVGPSMDNAIEFILNGRSKRNNGSNITQHLNFPKRMKPRGICDDASASKTNFSIRQQVPSTVNSSLDLCPDTFITIGFDWEEKVNNLIQKHFGYPSMKGFQKEVLAAWIKNQDCLVLAATGSGKSLCFQLPALLSGKVVVVVSPLISLMHDQCLKLGKHGISACFLGSGQVDKSVEQKAMNGVYNIIYVCPETILRLIKPLQSLAESRGIALFAIDEVHCVSKWGHDFRPDYRRLSALRENFRADKLKFLKFDIPLMALTATATVCVREDILKSLHMSKGTKIIITSFFRQNLRFSVKHSRTSSLSSYEKDFSELIGLYANKKNSIRNLISKDLENSSKDSSVYSDSSTSRPHEMCKNEVRDIDDNDFSDDDGFSENDSLLMEHSLESMNEKELSVQYLEDDCDQVQDVDDLDVSCGEFCGQSALNFNYRWTPDSGSLLSKTEERPPLHQGCLEEGPTIVYVPTRKETLSLTKFLSSFGVKAAAYNAKLPKSHLRQVHKEFHEDALQVVVATIAFGMGIDKSNVRRIIHYGWPQSLEAYFQEAGRAGRDGKLADCVLYANLSRIPTLLPSQRSAEQTKRAYNMLSDCFRYGMRTSSCRAKMLVEYFGEEFTQERCLLCDFCTNGPPEIQNLKAEARMFLQLIATHYGHYSCQDVSCDDDDIPCSKDSILKEKPNVRTFVRRIREQNPTFAVTDFIWWRGLARILEDRGFIRDGDDKSHVQIQCPEPTDAGLHLLKYGLEEAFNVFPEADMVLSMKSQKSYSSFSEWGRGWADPEIRRQRLERRKTWRRRKPRNRKSHPDLSTVRGRLSAKLSK